MAVQQPRSDDPTLRRELLLVAALTAVGGLIRLWAPHRLGLVHFDEGIYALAALWPFHRGGLSTIDPTVIAYAPPGFPFLVGLSDLVLGVSDLAAILVSVIAGTLTIPAAAWFARRTFGPGAGAAAAAIVAFSGVGIAFSRMALTDACFGLAWLLGLLACLRFLEKPGALSGLALGLATGAAQLIKYNGWLIGGVLILAALLGCVFDSRERTRPRLTSIWGFGLAAGVVACLVYWPWFQFVESHGGYTRLLAHHRSYLGGPGSWLPHLRVQLAQLAALSGDLRWRGAGMLTVSVATSFCLWLPIRLKLTSLATAIGMLAGLTLFPQGIWWISLFWALLLSNPRRPADRLLLAAVLGLSLLTPFYHPYARLWLPLQLLSCLVIAGLLSRIIQDWAPPSGGESTQPHRREVTFRWTLAVILLLPLFLVTELVDRPSASSTSGPGNPTILAASDSLRTAVSQAVKDIPPAASGLRLLVRPSVTFYLGGRVPARTVPSLSALLEAGASGEWALVDTAQLLQEGDLADARRRLLSRWELVREYPNQLNLPTLLDVDPLAARTGHSSAVECALLLLRPRIQGPSS